LVLSDQKEIGDQIGRLILLWFIYVIQDEIAQSDFLLQHDHYDVTRYVLPVDLHQSL